MGAPWRGAGEGARRSPRKTSWCQRTLHEAAPDPHPPLRGTFSRREKGFMISARQEAGAVRFSPSPTGRGVGVRVRGEALANQLVPTDAARGCARTLIRPCGAPSPEKGAMVPMGEGSIAGLCGYRARPSSPSPTGRGVGVRVRREALAKTACTNGRCTRLRPDPHPLLRGTFPPKRGPWSQGEKRAVGPPPRWNDGLRRPRLAAGSGTPIFGASPGDRLP